MPSSFIGGRGARPPRKRNWLTYPRGPRRDRTGQGLPDLGVAGVRDREPDLRGFFPLLRPPFFIIDQHRVKTQPPRECAARRNGNLDKKNEQEKQEERLARLLWNRWIVRGGHSPAGSGAFTKALCGLVTKLLGHRLTKSTKETRHQQGETEKVRNGERRPAGVQQGE